MLQDIPVTQQLQLSFFVFLHNTVRKQNYYALHHKSHQVRKLWRAIFMWNFEWNFTRKRPSRAFVTKWFWITSKVYGFEFFCINIEVTSEVFRDFRCMIKFLSGWYFMMVEATSARKFGQTPKISKNFRSNFYIKTEELPSHELLNRFWIIRWLLWCMKHYLSPFPPRQQKAFQYSYCHSLRKSHHKNIWLEVFLLSHCDNPISIFFCTKSKKYGKCYYLKWR